MSRFAPPVSVNWVCFLGVVVRDHHMEAGGLMDHAFGLRIEDDAIVRKFEGCRTGFRVVVVLLTFFVRVFEVCSGCGHRTEPNGPVTLKNQINVCKKSFHRDDKQLPEFSNPIWWLPEAKRYLPLSGTEGHSTYFIRFRKWILLFETTCKPLPRRNRCSVFDQGIETGGNSGTGPLRGSGRTCPVQWGKVSAK
jgi:hypothetical protein